MSAAAALALLLHPLAATASDFERSADFCRAGKAFGIKLGSGEIEGQHLSVTSSLVALAPDYRPFDSAEAVVTLHGRRTHTVHGEADFDNDGDAVEARVQIRAALIAAGWQSKQDRQSAAGEIFYSSSAASDLAKPRGLVADLFTLGSRLYFSCSDAALLKKSRAEFPPPAGAPPR